MTEMPPCTCPVDDQVFQDIELIDTTGAVVAGPLVSTECNAQWMADAAPFFDMWGPNYPLTWRHTPPTPPDDGESQSEQDPT